MRRVLIVTSCAALLVLVSACSVSIGTDSPPTRAPTCPASHGTSAKRLPGPLVLTAQSVPSSGLVPCLRALPAGWRFQRLDAQKGKARIYIDFEHEGSHAAVVTLARTCDTRGSRQTRTDKPGTQRYDRVDDLTRGYRGQRLYIYPGGCTSYQFNVEGGRARLQVVAISQSLGFVDRDLVRRYVHDYSGDRFELDPVASGGA